MKKTLLKVDRVAVQKQNEPYYLGDIKTLDTQLIDTSDCWHNGDPSRSDSYILKNEANPMQSIEISEKQIFFVTSNSAHHMSHYLASCAFKNVEATASKLVLNFDQHEDHGSETDTKKMLCSNWGGYTKGYNSHYAVVGRPMNGKPMFYLYGDTKEKFDSFNELKVSFNRYSHIYVTIDMDILTNNSRESKRTNWNEGCASKKDLIEWINSLPPKIISADITGFPPQARSASASTNEEDLNAYIADIHDVAKALEAIMLPTTI